LPPRRPGGLWQDIKFDWKHLSDFERIAFIGDKSWGKSMAKFCKPFATAKIRYFTPDEVDEARQWIEQD
jgi:hypothetical protein